MHPMTFHYIEAETYCHATEDPGRVKEALSYLLGPEVDVEVKDTRGHYGNPISVLKAMITRKREIRGMFERLDEEVIDRLKASIDERLDDDCNFFFRLDRGSLYLGKAELTRGDYVVKVRGKVECYPAKREKAEEKLKDLFSDRGEER